ncbi:MAG: hypothetical protein J7L50_02570 [Candidatus Odinarchaeota archaeon]|nr:hypothetical protein [Candidatus Odinarchaeota archaeon]
MYAYRKLSGKRKSIIKEYLKKLNVSMRVLDERYELILLKRRDVHLVNKEMMRFLPKIFQKDPSYASMKIYSLGVFFGRFQRDEFKMTIEGARLISHYMKKVRVNEKGEQLFLYGRDILGESLTYVDPTVSNGDIVSVNNKMDEFLGIGEWVVGSRDLDGLQKKVVVRNKADLGMYLKEDTLPFIDSV